MSAYLPRISFPGGVLDIPPSPESTLEPLPPDDDPRLAGSYFGLDDLQWYMYSALQNNRSYPNDSFSWGNSDVHMGDVLEPLSIPPERYPNSEEKDWLLGWEMSCLLCPTTPQRGEPERHPEIGFLFCDNEMLSAAPIVSYSAFGESDIEVPVSTISGGGSLMACVVVQKLDPKWVMWSSSPIEQHRVISKPFIVSRRLRGPESEYPGIRYRYSANFPKGVLDNQAEELDLPFPFPIATPTTTRDPYDWWDATSTARHTTPTWTPKDEDDYHGRGKQIGIIIGTLVPVVLLLAVFALFYKRKHQQQPKTTVSVSVPRNSDPAADARRQVAFPERVYISGRNCAAATSTSGRTGASAGQQGEPDGLSTIAQDDPEEMPPAYHKVVTNLERMEIEERMQAEGTAPQGWPPAYRDAQNAASTPVSRPEPTASIPAQGRDLYPALPPSPPR